MTLSRKLRAGIAAASIIFSATAHAASGQIDIGMIADLTGAGALSGQHKVNGAKLAVDEINAKGGINGKKINLIVEDDQGMNQVAVSAYQRLASNQNVIAIIGPITSTMTNALSPYVTRFKIPTMIGGTDPALTQKGNQWMFRFRPSDVYASDVMANYSVKQMGAKKVAILYTNDAFGTTGNKLLKAALEKDGAKIASDQGFETGTKDFTSYIETIKHSGADTLETYTTSSQDDAQILRQIRQLGLKVKIIGSPSIAAAACIQIAGNAANGIYSVSDFAPQGNDAAKEFTRKYEAKYQSPPDLYGSWVYDAVNVLSQVIAKDGTSGPAIQRGIRAVQGYNGVEGTYNFDANGDGLHGYSVVKINNDKVTLVKYVDFYKK